MSSCNLHRNGITTNGAEFGKIINVTDNYQSNKVGFIYNIVSTPNQVFDLDLHINSKTKAMYHYYVVNISGENVTLFDKNESFVLKQNEAVHIISGLDGWSKIKYGNNGPWLNPDGSQADHNSEEITFSGEMYLTKQEPGILYVNTKGKLDTLPLDFIMSK